MTPTRHSSGSRSAFSREKRSPGTALNTISGTASDYLDSQMLLQDIAYYPLGHPKPSGGISVTDHSPNGIGRIIDSLMSQASEGED